MEAAAVVRERAVTTEFWLVSRDSRKFCGLFEEVLWKLGKFRTDCLLRQNYF